MARDTQSLIADLVDDLAPVSPATLRSGVALTTAALLLTMVAVAVFGGIRADLRAGHVDPIFPLSAGLFLLLGCAASLSVVTMSRPHIGSEHGGWKWAVAMVALLPATAVVTLAMGNQLQTYHSLYHDLSCLLKGSALGMFTAICLTLLLRKGAPTSPEQAGLLTGIAAGSFGTFSFAFSCNINDIIHIGIWHSLVVVVGGLVGSAVVPRLIRW